MDLSQLTFGAEHEFADWDASQLKNKLPNFGRDEKDITVVNSNGIANDPKLTYYKFGGEINTPVSDTIDGQADYLNQFNKIFLEAKVNYRSNLHFHVGVPGLKESLIGLKAFAHYNAYWLPKVLDWIEPIPEPFSYPLPTEDNVLSFSEEGAIRRFRRRKRSHHTILPKNRLFLQSLAKTPQAFFEAEVPISKDVKQRLWHFQPRAAVNLRQMLQTDSIEFRHWPGTLDPDKLIQVGLWCRCYTLCALGGWGSPGEVDPRAVFISAGGNAALIPQFEPYDHSLEIRYRATCHDGTLSKTLIVNNIESILAGTFDDEKWNHHYKW
jgi:hypothetical protein